MISGRKLVLQRMQQVLRRSSLLLGTWGPVNAEFVNPCSSICSSRFPFFALGTSLHHERAHHSRSLQSIFDFVDLSEYFITGSDYRRAPKFQNYIGPVRIDRTPDGRGRGLYVSQDVEAGDILIINNAFAASYNDIHNSQMHERIAAILKDSPRALRQFYSLAADTQQEKLAVPEVELFDDSIPYHGDDSSTPGLSESKIRKIIQVNSFSGKLTLPGHQEAGRINGLWLLPSFINHSCCPTASRLLVGETMLFMAAQNMKANDELTICYTDCMAPLRKREEVLGITCCGFRCRCERCEFEQSIQKEVEDISERYQALYDKAVEEVTAVATRRDKGPYPACRELAVLFVKLRTKLDSMKELTKLQKHWILGGYSCAFLGNWLTTGYMSDFGPPCRHLDSTAIGLVEAMKVTVPGMQRTLSFSVLLATAVKESAERLRLVELALNECVKLYGKQRPDVLRKLAQDSVQYVPFL
ncbi:hypothetical protein KP509_39G017700 [Ceratopteris richardii]|uniref:SET domain-containing protein n=1 Tax=Ceratopteris richardii TaxID=49495 RepID=A0A8T2PZ35_CERRI|nr:hypothetical protein KP509_39G017700 [Ceratopteris richardii]